MTSQPCCRNVAAIAWTARGADDEDSVVLIGFHDVSRCRKEVFTIIRPEIGRKTPPVHSYLAANALSGDWSDNERSRF
jgi:hypothetical protein